VSRVSRPLAQLTGLKAHSFYRVRVLASKAAKPELAGVDGLLSRPSLPAQFETLSADEGSALTPVPQRARFDFTVPCARRDIVLGDLVLFTERPSGCYRTVAGRIVAVKGDEEGAPANTAVFWLQVEWATLANQAQRNKLEIAPGSRIQRKEAEIFAFEAELGVYRMAWVDEQHRWSRHQERMHVPDDVYEQRDAVDDCDQDKNASKS
jgi:hypothetical protein